MRIPGRGPAAPRGAGQTLYSVSTHVVTRGVRISRAAAEKSAGKPDPPPGIAGGPIREAPPDEGKMRAASGAEPCPAEGAGPEPRESRQRRSEPPGLPR